MLTILPSDSFITQAITEIVTDTQNLLSAAEQARPIDREEVSFWRRQANAANRAEYHWRSGIRPVLSDAAYLLPSASQGGCLIHRLIRHGGVLVCDCKASQNGLLCWHHMFMNIVERAAELEALAEQEAELQLAKKISAARARAMAEMDEVFGVKVLREDELRPF